MGLYYIRRKDNPLKILAWAHTTAPGQVRTFESDIYEEVEGELPDGYSLEPKPKTADDLLNELGGVFQSADLSVQYAFLQPMAGVSAAAKGGNVPLMRYIIEQTDVPEELEPFKQSMLAVFEEP